MNGVNAPKAISLAAVIVIYAVGCGLWDDSGASCAQRGEAPYTRPPPSTFQPIDGDTVTLREAQRRTPYTIPIPPQSAVGADLEEVWASPESYLTEYKQVYLKYSSGLEIFISGSMEYMDYGEDVDSPFKQANVRGIGAEGLDHYIKTTKSGTRESVPGSLSWWVNQVDIRMVHPTLTIQELVAIAEAMPDPTWSSN